MAYNIYTPQQGPNIDVNLFPQSAALGSRVGQEIGSTTSNIISGIKEGVEFGQQFRKNEEAIETENQLQVIRENQIARIPQANELQDQQIEQNKIQLENAKTINEINKLKLDIQQQTQQQQIEQTKLQLENEKNKLTTQNQDLKASKTLSELLANPTMDGNVDAVLRDPSVQSYLSRNPEEFNYLSRRLDPYIVDPQLKQYFKESARRAKELDLEFKREELSAKLDEQIVSNYQKAQEDFIKVPQAVDLLQSTGGLNSIEGYEFHQKGSKQLSDKSRKRGSTILPDTADTPEAAAAFPDTFEAFRGGVKVGELKSGAVDKFIGLQTSSAAYMGLVKKKYGRDQADEPPAAQSQATPTPQKAASTPAAQAPETPSRLQVAPQELMSRAAEEGKDRGFYSTNLERAVQAIVPSVLRGEIDDASLNVTPLSTGSVQELKGAVRNAASTLAGKTMEQYTNGTPDQRQALNDWAESNGMANVTFANLRQYYEDAANDQLKETFDKAFSEGMAQRDTLTRSQAEVAKAEVRKQESFKGMTPEDALKLSQQTEALTGKATPTPAPTAPPIDLKAKVNNVAASVGLSTKQAQYLYKTASRVQAVPLLQDKPPYVKALAAVESQGKPGQTSPTGVKGYMQVTKATAGIYGLNRNKPEENVLAGQLYIEDLTRQFQGNRLLAYAAYNTGPAVVRYAQQLAKSNDWAEVKKFLPQALKKFEKQIGVNAAEKLEEVYNYPERVNLFEMTFTT